MTKVALVKGTESYQAVAKALATIRGNVQVPRDRPVLVKPNLVRPNRELVATPVGAVRATLDFLMNLGVKKFIVGEATALAEGDTMGAFRRYGYLPLADEYDVELRDLNQDDWVGFEALDDELRPVTVRCFWQPNS